MKLFLIMAAAMAAVPVSANAATLVFTLSGPAATSFLVDSDPTAESPTTDSFTLSNVAGSYAGRSMTFATMAFWMGATSGGLQIIDPVDNNTVVFDLSGDQLFSGTTALPRFRPGSFTLNTAAGDTVSLSIAAAAAAVPEPASWALMIVGFGVVGFRMRRRTMATSVA